VEAVENQSFIKNTRSLVEQFSCSEKNWHRDCFVAKRGILSPRFGADVSFFAHFGQKKSRKKPLIFKDLGIICKKLKIYCEKSLTFFEFFVLFAPPR
jgi:hypothetical protein